MPAGNVSPAFSPAPSLDPSARPTIAVATSAPASATAVGILVGATGEVPASLGAGRAQLEAAGFDGQVGATLAWPGDGPTQVAVGVGDPAELDSAGLRDAAAAFGRAASTHTSLAMTLPDAAGVAPETAGQAMVEGLLLARYRYDVLRREPKGQQVRELTLITSPAAATAAGAGAERGQVFASATMLARDLANTPYSHLSASRLADLAVTLGRERGFSVEVFDEHALAELGCGGLLGVNRGSVEPPRLIKLRYQPTGEPTGRLALVGKGIMYDSGGISLKPSDPIHAQMKNDMSGAAAILAAVAPLAEVGCTAAVTGFLMCTDNMPSGSAMALGDVLTIRDGTTVEVIDTDAEGRLAMSDGLALAAEDEPDAIVDIATLTGSCQRALGPDMAGVLGNHQAMVDQVKAAAEATGERVWRLPLHRPYRRLLDSGVADLMNVAPVGLPDAIIASLFLAEFVGDIPWAHLDIAGTAQADTDNSWRPKGVTGFGARLLLDLALRFTQPGS
jgi:leucyl aminopeptidase